MWWSFSKYHEYLETLPSMSIYRDITCEWNKLWKYPRFSLSFIQYQVEFIWNFWLNFHEIFIKKLPLSNSCRTEASRFPMKFCKEDLQKSLTNTLSLEHNIRLILSISTAIDVEIYPTSSSDGFSSSCLLSQVRTFSMKLFSLPIIYSRIKRKVFLDSHTFLTSI